jgi:glycosyltransferase involved in cell wall biosynthesis
LDSVVAQTFDDWHLVVVNHGGDRQIVESCVDRVAGTARGKVEILHLEAGGGMERASNAGLDRLDTAFFGIHDDDDTWMPTFLERTVAFLQDPAHDTFGAVTTHAIKRWERIEDGHLETVEDEGLNTSEEFVDAQQLFGWNRVFTINTLFRSAVRDVVGPYNEDLDVIGDWEFHVRVAAATDIALIPEVLARYHIRHVGGDPEYANSVIAGWSRHRELDARLRAALLRRFIDADPSRLGLVVAQSHDAEVARQAALQVDELVRLIDWRTHHTGNRINDIHDRVIAMGEMLDELQREMADVRVHTYRIRQAFATLAAPARPLRRLRERWRLRSAASDAPVTPDA